MIDRKSDFQAVKTALRRSRIVALLGPRQCGKTTLAQQFVAADSLNYLDLESPSSLARLDEPETTLRPLKGLVVIDEVQRRPELFPLLRVLADRKPLPARFLILGSASPDLLRQSSETLAGRLETVSLEGFRLRDLGTSQQYRHWLRGGIPACLYSPERGRFAPLASTVSPDVSGKRHSATRDQYSCGDLATVLEHGGTLPRSNLECRGTFPRAGSWAIHRATVSGSHDQCFHDPSIATLV